MWRVRLSWVYKEGRHWREATDELGRGRSRKPKAEVFEILGLTKRGTLASIDESRALAYLSIPRRLAIDGPTRFCEYRIGSYAMASAKDNRQDRRETMQGVPEGFHPLSAARPTAQVEEEKKMQVKDRQVANVCCTWH
jgi:hypothetical protein